MDHPLSVSEEELLRALDLPIEAKEGVTSEELADRFGCHKNTITRRLGQLKKEGRVEMVGWKYLPRLDGCLHPRPAYRLKRAAEPDS